MLRFIKFQLFYFPAGVLGLTYVPYRLFGAFTAQLYYYYVTFRHDNRSLKIYVWLMG